MHFRKPPTMAIVVAAICFSNGAFAVDGGRPRHPAIHRTAPWARSANMSEEFRPATHWKRNAARRLTADRDPYVDPAAPYKANRLSSQPSQRIIDVPSQTTILTRQVLDDKSATSLRDALRTTPGVTVRR